MIVFYLLISFDSYGGKKLRIEILNLVLETCSIFIIYYSLLLTQIINDFFQMKFFIVGSIILVVHNAGLSRQPTPGSSFEFQNRVQVKRVLITICCKSLFYFYVLTLRLSRIKIIHISIFLIGMIHITALQQH